MNCKVLSKFFQRSFLSIFQRFLKFIQFWLNIRALNHQIWVSLSSLRPSMPSIKLTPSMGILTTKHENLQPNRHKKKLSRGRKNGFSLIYQKKTINHLEAQKLGNLNPNGNGKRLISALGLSTLTILLRSF